MRRLSRRADAHTAAMRRNYRDVASILDPPRKPLLTNGQVRRFVRRNLATTTNGAPA
jgi:hypothetical protein